MRVLQVIPSVSLVHGGPSVAVRQIEHALHAQGVEVETATTDDDGPGRRNGLGSARATENGVLRLYFRKRTEFYKVAPGFLLWAFKSIKFYDIVHIHALFSFTSVVAAMAARWAGVPYIVRPLGVLNKYGITQRRPLLKRLSLRFIEGPILRHAAAVHFTAAVELDEAVATGITMNGVVVPLGVSAPEGGDSLRFLADHPELEGQIRLLFLSRLDPKKNLEGLIKAMALLRADSLPVKLIVAGSGEVEYVAGLHRLAEGNGVAAEICWLGQVGGQQKSDVLAAADIFVLPSYSENFGIAVVEAMASGLPCVLGQGVALASAVEAEGAGLSVAACPAAIAAAVGEYVRSGGKRRIAGRAARLLSDREYSVKIMGQRLVALYKSIHSLKVAS